MSSLWAALHASWTAYVVPATPWHPTGLKLVGEAVRKGISGARWSRLCATKAEVQSASHNVGVGLTNGAAIQQRHLAIDRKHRAAKRVSVAALDTAAAIWGSYR